mmetsp:Transcript_6543/g.18368  ORF Transcript_6543/g.18368 Transcript_6543/m.18368 type:complete len:126 (-) Transcript_6543:52-429(-)
MASSPALPVDVYLLGYHRDALPINAKDSASCMCNPQAKVEAEQVTLDKSASKPLTEPTANTVYMPPVADGSETKTVTSPEAFVAVPPSPVMMAVYTEYEARAVTHKDRNKQFTDDTDMVSPSSSS